MFFKFFLRFLAIHIQLFTFKTHIVTFPKQTKTQQYVLNPKDIKNNTPRALVSTFSIFLQNNLHFSSLI